MDSLDPEPKSEPRPETPRRGALRTLRRLAPLVVVVLAIAVGCESKACSTDLKPPGMGLSPVGTLAEISTMHVWVDLGLKGVYTPTSASQTAWLPWQSLAVPTGIVDTALNELADKGYLALRVPDIDTQVSAVRNPTVTLNYYSPPDSPSMTSVPITVARRVSFEAELTSRFGTDGRSHWEAWWLPAGQRFPVPTSPYRAGPLNIQFDIDFGPGADSRNAIGRQIAWAMYNGFTFVGPIEKTISTEFWPIPVPPVR